MERLSNWKAELLLASWFAKAWLVDCLAGRPVRWLSVLLSGDPRTLQPFNPLT